MSAYRTTLVLSLAASTLLLACGSADDDLYPDTAPLSDSALLDDHHPATSYLDDGGVRMIPDQGLRCDFYGNLVADPAHDYVYAIETSSDGACADFDAAFATDELVAFSPDGTTATLATLTGLERPELIPMADYVVLANPTEAGTDLTRYATGTWEAETTHTSVSAFRQRSDAAGRYLTLETLVDVNDLHLFEAATGTLFPMPTAGADVAGVRWSHSGSTLVAVLAYGSTESAPAQIRVVRWDLAATPVSSLVEDATGLWDQRTLDVTLEAAGPGLGGLLDDGAVLSPDDQTLVYSAALGTEGELDADTIVVDLVAGTATAVTMPGLLYRFSADGQTIYSDGADTVGAYAIATGEVRELPLPGEGWQLVQGLDAGHLLFSAEAGFVVLDAETETFASVPDSALSRRAVALRGDTLWQTMGGLEAIELDAAAVVSPALDVMPEHVAYLPGADLLAVDDIHTRTITFWDPETASVFSQVTP